ncbi:MAG: F0F1 ATP synthase subunit epsilon [Solirubrobacteraceae bacterium]
MDIEILSPIKKIFSGSVDSVIVPGKNGSFQMLNNHAPIVSVLGKGKIEIFTKNSTINPQELDSLFVQSLENSSIYTIAVDSGVIELNKNKLIILIE